MSKPSFPVASNPTSTTAASLPASSEGHQQKASPGLADASTPASSTSGYFAASTALGSIYGVSATTSRRAHSPTPGHGSPNGSLKTSQTTAKAGGSSSLISARTSTESLKKQHGSSWKVIFEPELAEDDKAKKKPANARVIRYNGILKPDEGPSIIHPPTDPRPGTFNYHTLGRARKRLTHNLLEVNYGIRIHRSLLDAPPRPPPTRHIFVSGLPVATTTEDLHTYFGIFGDIGMAINEVHPHTAQNVGLASVSYAGDELSAGTAATAAVEQMSGRLMEGRSIRVELDPDGSKKRTAIDHLLRPSAPSTAYPGPSPPSIPYGYPPPPFQPHSAPRPPPLPSFHPPQFARYPHHQQSSGYHSGPSPYGPYPERPPPQSYRSGPPPQQLQDRRASYERTAALAGSPSVHPDRTRFQIGTPHSEALPLHRSHHVSAREPSVILKQTLSTRSPPRGRSASPQEPASRQPASNVRSLHRSRSPPSREWTGSRRLHSRSPPRRHSPGSRGNRSISDMPLRSPPRGHRPLPQESRVISDQPSRPTSRHGSPSARVGKSLASKESSPSPSRKPRVQSSAEDRTREQPVRVAIAPSVQPVQPVKIQLLESDTEAGEIDEHPIRRSTNGAGRQRAFNRSRSPPRGDRALPMRTTIDTYRPADVSSKSSRRPLEGPSRTGTDTWRAGDPLVARPLADTYRAGDVGSARPIVDSYRPGLDRPAEGLTIRRLSAEPSRRATHTSGQGSFVPVKVLAGMAPKANLTRARPRSRTDSRRVRRESRSASSRSRSRSPSGLRHRRPPQEVDISTDDRARGRRRSLSPRRVPGPLRVLRLSRSRSGSRTPRRDTRSRSRSRVRSRPQSRERPNGQVSVIPGRHTVRHIDPGEPSSGRQSRQFTPPSVSRGSPTKFSPQKASGEAAYLSPSNRQVLPVDHKRFTQREGPLRDVESPQKPTGHPTTPHIFGEHTLPKAQSATTPETLPQTVKDVPVGNNPDSPEAEPLDTRSILATMHIGRRNPDGSVEAKTPKDAAMKKRARTFDASSSDDDTVERHSQVKSRGKATRKRTLKRRRAVESAEESDGLSEHDDLATSKPVIDRKAPLSSTIVEDVKLNVPAARKTVKEKPLKTEGPPKTIQEDAKPIVKPPPAKVRAKKAAIATPVAVTVPTTKKRKAPIKKPSHAVAILPHIPTAPSPILLDSDTDDDISFARHSTFIWPPEDWANSPDSDASLDLDLEDSTCLLRRRIDAMDPEDVAFLLQTLYTEQHRRRATRAARFQRRLRAEADLRRPCPSKEAISVMRIDSISRPPSPLRVPPSIHKSGAARTEPVYRLSYTEKAAAAKARLDLTPVAATDTTPTTLATTVPDRPIAIITHRPIHSDTRIRSKPRAHGMHSRLTTSQENQSDSLQFHSLNARHSSLRFGRSPIHDWGLFATILIPALEFVIEYIGEIVREKVADTRERRYERRGIDSSYLFRIDAENIVDATFKGNMARFINHNCEPNCSAKIITVAGRRRIVIYANRDIQAGEEITYDYQFPLEEEKIPCLCGAAACRGTLN